MLAYHGYAMTESSMNSAPLYETNQFLIKCFSCLFSHHNRINWFCLKKLNVFFQYIGKKTSEYLNSAEQSTKR